MPYNPLKNAKRNRQIFSPLLLTKIWSATFFKESTVFFKKSTPFFKKSTVFFKKSTVFSKSQRLFEKSPLDIPEGDACHQRDAKTPNFYLERSCFLQAKTVELEMITRADVDHAFQAITYLGKEAQRATAHLNTYWRQLIGQMPSAATVV